jgi:hypothetical protein
MNWSSLQSDDNPSISQDGGRELAPDYFQLFPDSTRNHQVPSFLFRGSQFFIEMAIFSQKEKRLLCYTQRSIQRDI